jgi:bis(5'-nucleosyl)-tetraphosphatase (symmetrical)
MAIYAIGDVQGCFAALQRLIEKTRFDPTRDRLWFVGDLVNRGTESLAVLRYVMGLGEAAVTVLGNHELHLLAVAAGVLPPHRKDTFHDVLTAPDREELLRWLRRRPLLHQERDLVLIHAGLLPQWTVSQAASLAQEVERVLRSDEYIGFLGYLYKVGYLTNSSPSRWADELTGLERLGVIANALTKLRVCSEAGDMHLAHKGLPEAAPPGFTPWFDVLGRRSREATVIFGHWAALGLRIQDRVLALDSGCVYGRQLTAVRLDDRQVLQVPFSGMRDPT